MVRNYPLVRITNQGTKHVFYACAHDHSTIGITTWEHASSTTFGVPAIVETETGTLSIGRNGIASKARRVMTQ